MRGSGGVVLAVGALVATPALANDKQDFESCDGRIHPGKQDDGMRGLASTPRWTMPGNYQAATVAACTHALASPRLLPTQSLRRAHLLRARAAAHLRAGETGDAIADLDLAQAAVSPLAGERFFQRSMGVSFQLLRAIALAQTGDTAGAVSLTRGAMAARPYSLQVQQVAATILQAARTLGDASPSPWTAVARLSPDAALTALVREAEVGNFPAVVAMRQGVTPEWPTERLAPLALATRAPGANQLMSAVLVTLNTAYARAATGDPQGARRDLDEVRTHVAALRPEGVQPESPLLNVASYSGIEKFVDVRGRQIDARIAVAERRPTEALSTLVATPMPHDAATADLLQALRAALPGDKAALIPDAAPFVADATKDRRSALVDAVPDALIVPETSRSVIDYSRARPNILGALVAGAFSMGTSLLGGISRTDGFRSTDNPDGTIKVEFIGNTTSPALVQEMTLLRAAEVTRGANKPAFVVVKRADFGRRLVTTRYGAEVSSVPTGFKSELTIRCLDAGQEPGRALSAVGIIDALGPFYYEEKKES